MFQVGRIGKTAARGRRDTSWETGPAVDALESRALLTAVLVNTTIDQTFPPQSGTVSLRDAIATANASTTPTTITFDAAVFHTFATMSVSSPLVFNGAQPVTITGPSATLALIGNGSGAILQISSGQATITQMLISGGFPDISNSGTLTLNSITVEQAHNAGIVNAGTLTVNNCALASNTSTTAGGGIYNSTGATLTLNSTFLTGNTAPDGAGIFNNAGTVNLDGCQFQNNDVNALGGHGGAVLNRSGTLIANATLFVENQATTGGAIDNQQGTVYCTNDTFNQNVANSGNGGALSNGDSSFPTGGHMTLINCTITANSAAVGGGLFRTGAANTISVGNTIIAGNSQTGTSPIGPDVYEQQTSLGHNFIGNADGSKDWTATDLVGTSASPIDPQLQTLADFGGVTDTIVPKLGSPVIDAGLSTIARDSAGKTLKTDARGFARQSGKQVDIGADEFQPFRFTFPAGTDTATLQYNTGGNLLLWIIGGTTVAAVSRTDDETLIIAGNGDNDVVQIDGASGHLAKNLRLSGTFTFNGFSFNNPLAGSTVDLGTNTLFISYAGAASDPIGMFRTYLSIGYHNALWNGSSSLGAIISSAAAANLSFSTAVGYADSADGQLSLPASTIELKYTLYGDTGLAGTVGFNDFTRMTQHYTQSSGATWLRGDFNYDGAINSNDFNLLKPNYGSTLPAPVPTSPPEMTPIVAAAPASSTADSMHRDSNLSTELADTSRSTKQEKKKDKAAARRDKTHGH